MARLDIGESRTPILMVDVERFRGKLIIATMSGTTDWHTGRRQRHANTEPVLTPHGYTSLLLCLQSFKANNLHNLASRQLTKGSSRGCLYRSEFRRYGTTFWTIPINQDRSLPHRSLLSRMKLLFSNRNRLNNILVTLRAMPDWRLPGSVNPISAGRRHTSGHFLLQLG